MEEKKQKKIKASPRPGKLAGYMICLKNIPGKTSLPRQGPFLPSREEKMILMTSGAVQGAYAIRPYIRVPIKKTPPKFFAMNH